MLRLIMYHRRVISGGFRAASNLTRREGVRCTPRLQGGMRHVLSPVLVSRIPYDTAIVQQHEMSDSGRGSRMGSKSSSVRLLCHALKLVPPPSRRPCRGQKCRMARIGFTRPRASHRSSRSLGQSPSINSPNFVALSGSDDAAAS